MNNRVEKNKSNKLLLAILILLFCFTLYISLQYIVKYQKSQNNQNNNIIEIKNKDVSISILNSENIDEVITNKSFKEDNEIIIERINYIEVITLKEKENTIKYNVKYNILKNDFKNNIISSNKSEVLVRFSYSYDNKEWIYVNNVISTNSSNISPLIGNNYDIGGLITTLNVATDFELNTKSMESAKVYWRSETIFKNFESQYEVDEYEKNLNANFTIEYKTGV